MKDKVVLRIAEIKDVPKMIVTLKKASQENPIEGFPSFLDNDATRWLISIMGMRDAYVCNAFIDNRIAGCLAVRAIGWGWNNSKCFLQSEWFCVLDAFRKHSVAGKLVDQAINVANHHKLDVLFTGITFLNGAVRLFESKGLQFRGGFYFLPYVADDSILLDERLPPTVKRTPPRTLAEVSDNDFVEGKNNGRLSIVAHST